MPQMNGCARVARVENHVRICSFIVADCRCVGIAVAVEEYEFRRLAPSPSARSEEP